MPGTAGSFLPMNAFKRLRASQILHNKEAKREGRKKGREEKGKEGLGKSSVFCKIEAI